MALPQGKPDRSQMQGTRKRAMEVRAPILVEARLMGVNRCAKLRAETNSASSGNYRSPGGKGTRSTPRPRQCSARGSVLRPRAD